MDLSVEYMGLKLKHPIVPSSSPLSHTVDGIRALEDAGASAVVMYSLFEEQITSESFYLDDLLTYGTNCYSEALDYFPDLQNYNVGPDEYLELIRKAKAATEIPIIGSLNGVSTGGWIEYASMIEEAGADALELNIYYIPTNPDMTSKEVESLYVDVLRDVKRAVEIPVAMKLNPYFSSVGNVARNLADEGANALVLFNRFYQPDFDLETLEVKPKLFLSHSPEIRLPLSWVAILYGQVFADFAITTGIHTHEDVLKGLMAGAKVTMMASELLQNGIGRINSVLTDMQNWMVEHEYESVRQMIGSMSRMNVSEPAAFERANYIKMLASYRPMR